ncbi:hypothetical protein RUM43_009133, partial [Polyplax serrata]
MPLQPDDYAKKQGERGIDLTGTRRRTVSDVIVISGKRLLTSKSELLVDGWCLPLCHKKALAFDVASIENVN